MVVILAPDGKSFADRIIEPMTADQITWFSDPVAFLHHMPHLWTLKLRVYCQRCWKRGATDDVRVRWDDTNGIFWASCGCSQTEGRLPIGMIHQCASSTDELLQRLGWSLCCTSRCSAEPGQDGVEAGNDINAATLHIRCRCTDRRYVMPNQVGLPS